MNYRKFTVFLISCCAAFLGNVIYTLSCGPTPDPYDYYVSFFNPYTKGKGYEPFYYSTLTSFYGDPTPSEESANVADWRRLTGGKVTARDIRECIYTYPQEQLSAIAAGSTGLPDSVMNNSFARFLLKDKHREAARYLLFAKTCEPAVNTGDPWSAPVRDNALMADLYSEGETLYGKTKNKYIRDRYAFQLVRLQHYSRQYAEAAALFDKLFGRKERTSLVYYKSLALKAGALLHLEDSVQSAYLFSRVFEKAPSLRISCFTSLMWTNTSPEEVYTLCRNNHEKAVVAAIFGLANSAPDVTAIRETYALDPASPALNILLAREMNKVEDTYVSTYLAEGQSTGGLIGLRDYSPGDSSKMTIQVKALQALTDSVIAAGKLEDKDFWQVSSAYLSYILKDFQGAKARLNKAAVKDPEVRDQWEIVNLLVNINGQKTIDSAFESQLLASFKWLDAKTPEGGHRDGWWRLPDEQYYFRKIYRNLLFAVLAPRYHAQGDEIKEALIRSRCDSLHINDYFVSGETAVEQVQDDMKSGELLRLYSFLHQPVKTPYESYLAGFFPQSLNMDRIIGESYMRVHDFRTARNWFRKVPANEQLASYQVFRPQLQDFGEDTAEAGYDKAITQYQFCERMIQLQEKMKKPAPAKVYYEYASALFNLSYYGRTWYFLKSYRPTWMWYTTGCDGDAFLKQYFGCYEAESYYLKAAEASTDKEFKARCLFLAARCSQKHTPENADDDKYITALVHNRYFPLLAGSYGQTEFYREALGQCSYLRDYVKSSRQ